MRSSSTILKDVLYAPKKSNPENLAYLKNKKISESLGKLNNKTWSDRFIPISKPINRLGPGAYEISPPKSQSPSWNFNSSPRFSSTYEDKLASFKFRHIQFSEEERNHQQLLHYKNMDLSRYTPGRKEEILKLKLENRLTREEIVRKTKDSIDRLLSETKKTKFESKIIKLRMRNFPNEYKEMYQKWVLLVIAFNIPNVFYWRATAKKKLRTRVARNANVLYWLCKILGKFKLVLSRYRKKRINLVRPI